MGALYIHIPFCLSKCGYCSFNSYAGMEELFPRYGKALLQELRRLSEQKHPGELETIYIGGGTPSILSGASIERLLSTCHECFTIAENAEITIEVNPGTADFFKLMHFRQAGANRLSIGVQSLIDSELAALGRIHSAQDACDVVHNAGAAGFTNISIDLISGIPGQTPEMWEWSLKTALALEITHLSLYQLTLEEDTPLMKSYEEGLVELPEEETVLQMDERTLDLTRETGLLQYEISNFARKGFRCRHNLTYWHNQEYLAAGAGAASYIKGVRARNISDPVAYCEAVETGGEIIEDQECLSEERSFRESVVVGLRMVDGISFAKMYQRYGIEVRTYYGQELIDLVHEGLLEVTRTHLRLTKRGRQLANQVLMKLV